jgi:acyl carrier protein
MGDYAHVEQVIKEILAKQLSMNAADIKNDALLMEGLGLDSFGSVEVAFELEERFALKIPDQALYEAKTVKDIVDYIFEQTKDRPTT